VLIAPQQPNVSAAALRQPEVAGSPLLTSSFDLLNYKKDQ
jgi:hypothetical protein